MNANVYRNTEAKDTTIYFSDKTGTEVYFSSEEGSEYWKLIILEKNGNIILDPDIMFVFGRKKGLCSPENSKNPCAYSVFMRMKFNKPVRMICEKLENMFSGSDLYTIFTPLAPYKDLSLESFSYGEMGMGSTTVDAVFTHHVGSNRHQ